MTSTRIGALTAIAAAALVLAGCAGASSPSPDESGAVTPDDFVSAPFSPAVDGMIVPTS